MREIREVRTNYIDFDNLQHIDCWFTDDENENGITVAVVDLDTKKVIYFDNSYRINNKVTEAINQILNK